MQDTLGNLYIKALHLQLTRNMNYVVKPSRSQRTSPQKAKLLLM